MKLYHVAGETVIAVDARLEGETYWYRDAISERPVHKDAVDCHWWFTTAEGAIRHRVGKMRESREVFIEARDSAAARVEQIEERIAKLEALL